MKPFLLLSTSLLVICATMARADDASTKLAQPSLRPAPNTNVAPNLQSQNYVLPKADTWVQKTKRKLRNAWYWTPGKKNAYVPSYYGGGYDSYSEMQMKIDEMQSQIDELQSQQAGAQ